MQGQDKKDGLEIQVKTLPETPGVYQFFDREKRMLYVGKAKNLKKRVSSYFTKTHSYGKTKVMVSKIYEIKHVVVKTESDALLLENNMIKSHQPRYNVLLKDDKSYPWICVKKEPFPRVFATRRLIKDGSQYFGPYTSMKTVRTLLDLFKSIYMLRSCHFDLSPEKVASKKVKLCLEYHIGNCAGPCQGLQSEEDYEVQIEAITNIIRGKLKPSLTLLKNQMLTYATNLEYEKAQRIKDRIDILERYQAKSTVVNPKISEVDVFSILEDHSHAYVNYLRLIEGCIVQSHTLEFKKKLEEQKEELLSLAIVELRQRFKSTSKELLLPFPVSLSEDLKVTIPKLGDKKQLIDLSLRNAKFYRQDRFKQMKIVDPDRHSSRIIAQLKVDLRMSKDPYHIECFDNSNIQGSNPVAACVVFKNAKPAKSEYRHFNIKTVQGPNDFASMEEVVFRRYKRLLEEDEPLPQLIVIDGGKGQLSSALKALELLDLRGKIAIIGIAKRLEEIYFPGDSDPLYLDKRSESLKLIQYLRNEAHRFGISFHRQKRSSEAIQTELLNIEGIGHKTANQLLREFRSVKGVKEASFNDLEALVGKVKSDKIRAYFKLNS